MSVATGKRLTEYHRGKAYRDGLYPSCKACSALSRRQRYLKNRERVLDFKTDRIVQTTFCEALEKLTDSDLGWRTMTQIYERELQRTDRLPAMQSTSLRPWKRCRPTCGASSRMKIQLRTGNRRVARTGSSAKRVPASVAGAATKAAVTCMVHRLQPESIFRY